MYEGISVITRETVAVEVLDKIGEILKDKGVSLDQLLEYGRDIREAIVTEECAL